MLTTNIGTAVLIIPTDIPFIMRGPVPLSEPVEDGDTAKIIFGLTRRDPTANELPSETGWSIVARLFFSVVGDGEFTFSFIDGTTLLADSTGNDAFDDSQWLAGSITTRQECL